MDGAVPLLSLYDLMTWTGKSLPCFMELGSGMLVQGRAMKWENFKTLKKLMHGFFIFLLVINEKHMNSHFVLCQFENLCFESNAVMMASVSTHAFLKSGSQTVHDLSQHLHRNCSHFILNSLFKSAIVLGLVSETFVFRYPQRK